MNFSLDGGWMLAIVVLIYVLVYVPNWGRRDEPNIEASSSGRKFSKKAPNTSKNAQNGVSQLIILNKNIRLIRRLFSALLVISFATAVYSVFKAVENLSWLALTVAAAAVFLTAASTLRSSRRKPAQQPAMTLQQLEEQRARMAYSIRESALSDAPAEQLFDERAWTAIALPESSLRRRIGELETVTLATVSDIDSAKPKGSEKKLDSTELDRILERRRAN
jgi:hypothetical protein